MRRFQDFIGRNFYMIETRNLAATREKGKKPAISGLDLQVGKGESCALLGANGAGKSTLLLALVGLAPILSGSAKVGGIEVQKKNLRKVRALAGLVFQNSDDQLFCPTVIDDVAFGIENSGVPRERAFETAEIWLERLSIQNLRDCSPNELSEGEKKRAAICGVSAMQPEIMLLDEPSAQLDPRGKRELADLLNSFKQTKIISTHDMQFARSVCNTAIVLDCGKLAARGNIDEILSDAPLLERCSLL